MNKLLALMCTAALAACGGGGSGDSAPTAQSTPNAGTSNPATPAAPVANPQTVGGNSITIDSANIRQIRVNGAVFDLVGSGSASVNGWSAQVPGFETGKSSGAPGSVSTFLVNTASANSSAGVLNINGRNQAFFNGHFTPEAGLPKGQVRYNASVAAMHGAVAYSVGRASLTADFDGKKLTGSIQRDADYGGNIPVNAQISGSRFSQSDATRLEGGFFGSSAAEIAGAFSNGNTTGAFVGSKQ